MNQLLLYLGLCSTISWGAIRGYRCSICYWVQFSSSIGSHAPYWMNLRRVFHFVALFCCRISFMQWNQSNCSTSKAYRPKVNLIDIVKSFSPFEFPCLPKWERMHGWNLKKKNKTNKHQFGVVLKASFYMSSTRVKRCWDESKKHSTGRWINKPIILANLSEQEAHRLRILLNMQNQRMSHKWKCCTWHKA